MNFIRNIACLLLAIFMITAMGACKKKKQVAPRVSSLKVGTFGYYCQSSSVTPTFLVQQNFAKMKVSITGTGGSYKVNSIFSSSTYPGATVSSPNSTSFSSSNFNISSGNCVAVEVPGNEGFTVDVLIHEGYGNKCTVGLNTCNAYAQSNSYSAGTVSSCSASGSTVIINGYVSVSTCM
jgi:hypothetical protein